MICIVRFAVVHIYMCVSHKVLIFIINFLLLLLYARIKLVIEPGTVLFVVKYYNNNN